MKQVIVVILLALLPAFAKAQDRIKLKNGDEIKCRVFKIANGKVVYKKLHNLKGPDLTYNKSEVEYIKYESGKVVFMDQKVKVKKPASTRKTTTKKK